MELHDTNHRPICFSVIGWHNAGKTTLSQAMIQDWTKRGLRVAAIKRDGHASQTQGDDWEKPGSDSVLLAQAGATMTLLVGEGRSLLRIQGDEETADVMSLCWRLRQHGERTRSPFDVILVEGFKDGPLPKVAVIGSLQEWEQMKQENVQGVHAVFWRNNLSRHHEPLTELNYPVFYENHVSALCDEVLTWQTNWE